MTDLLVTLDVTYATPMEHNNSMETHTTVAVWDQDSKQLILYDSTPECLHNQERCRRRSWDRPGRLRVISPYVGGGFGRRAFPGRITSRSGWPPR